MRRQVSRQLGSTLPPPRTQTAMAVRYLITAKMLLLVFFFHGFRHLFCTASGKPAAQSGALSRHQHGDALATDNGVSVGKKCLSLC